MMTISDAVSITEAARLLGTSRPTLSKLLSDHDFPRQRAGGKTLVSMAAVRQFYRAHKQGASRPGAVPVPVPVPKPEPEPEPKASLSEPEALSQLRLSSVEEQLAQLQQSLSQHKQELDQLRTQVHDGFRRQEQSRPQISDAAAFLQPAPPKSRANAAGFPFLKLIKDMFRPWGNA